MSRVRTVVVALVAATALGGVTLAFAAALTVSPKSLTASSTSVSVPKQDGTLSSKANQATATPGGSITATATLSGLIGSTPGGSVTFRLVKPAGATPTAAECAAAAPVGTKSVTANGDYVSDAVTAPAAASYWWYVTYDGDPNNAAAQGACGDNADKVVIGAAVTCGLTMSAPSTATAGTGFSVTLTMQKASGASCVTDPAYTGAHTMTWSGGNTSPPPVNRAPDRPGTSVTFTAGTATVSGWVLYAAGSSSISASDGTTTASASLTVNAVLSFDSLKKGTSSATCPVTGIGNSTGNLVTFKVNVKDSWANAVYASGKVALTVSLSDTTKSTISPGNVDVTSPSTLSGTETVNIQSGFQTTTINVSAPGYASISCGINR